MCATCCWISLVEGARLPAPLKRCHSGTPMVPSFGCSDHPYARKSPQDGELEFFNGVHHDTLPLVGQTPTITMPDLVYPASSFSRALASRKSAVSNPGVKLQHRFGHFFYKQRHSARLEFTLSSSTRAPLQPGDRWLRAEVRSFV